MINPWRKGISNRYGNVIYPNRRNYACFPVRDLIRLRWPEVEGGWWRTVSRGGKGVNTRGRTVLLSRMYLCPHYPAHDSRCMALFPVARSRISVSDGKSSFWPLKSWGRKIEKNVVKMQLYLYYYIINYIINYI